MAHEDAHVPSASENLEYLKSELKKRGYPPLLEHKEEKDIKEPTVAILGYIDFIFIIEGGITSPGNFIFCLEPDWLQSEVIDDKTNFHKILVKRGVYYKDGVCHLVEYAIPRVVDYFVNFYSVGAFADVPEQEKGIVKQSLVLETNFEGPMSNSNWLAKDVNDKILTRLLMEEKGVAIPRFVAFLGQFLKSVKPEYVPAIKSGLVNLMPKEESEWRSFITSKVNELKQKYPQYNEIVVKPSGIRFSCGEGIKFFNASDTEQIVDHVLSLVTSYHLGLDEGVLVDGRLCPPPLYEEGVKKDYNFRVFVVRNADDEGVVTGLFARVGKWSGPVNIALGAHFATYEEVIEGLQLNQEQKEALWKKILALGPGVLSAIKEHEERRKHVSEEPHEAQTDCMGLDIMLEERNGELWPVVIEINDHEAGGQQPMEDMHKGMGTAMLRPWMETMIRRARKHFEGKGKPVRHYKLVKNTNSSSELIKSMSSLNLKQLMSGPKYIVC